MREATRFVAVLTSVLAVALAAGCASKFKARSFDVHVDAGLTLKNATARVDIVGVSDTEKAAWEGVKMSEYWKPGNKWRESAVSLGVVYPMVFRSGEKSKVLPASDEVWNKWRAQAAWLFVLADLPDPAHVDMPGEADSWRAVLPLDKRRWDTKTTTVTITLESGMVKVDTQPLPPE